MTNFINAHRTLKAYFAKKLTWAQTEVELARHGFRFPQKEARAEYRMMTQIINRTGTWAPDAVA